MKRIAGLMKDLDPRREPSAATDALALVAVGGGTVVALALAFTSFSGWRLWAFSIAFSAVAFGWEEIGHSVGARRSRGELQGDDP